MSPKVSNARVTPIIQTDQHFDAVACLGDEADHFHEGFDIAKSR